MAHSTEKVVLPKESQDGYAHLKLDTDAWYIRFYLWLYEASRYEINTCKLFWAFVFAPLSLAIRGAAGFGAWLADKLPDKKSKTVTHEDWLTKMDKAEARRQKLSKMESRLERVTALMSNLYAKVAPALRWIGIVLGLLWVLAVVAACIYALIVEPVEMLTAIGVCVAVVALIVGGTYLFVEKKAGMGFFKLFGRLAVGFHRHTCAKIELSDKD